MSALALKQDVERVLYTDLEGNQKLVPYADGMDGFDVVWLGAQDGEVFWVGEMTTTTTTTTEPPASI